ncbi:MAG TPA: hypothetical protein VMS21_10520, partial [Methylomirabilota bacterium]|nr:hypothetical protein [Methylomirabilota bacterium]
MRLRPWIAAAACAGYAALTFAQAAPVSGWLHWRGPQQNGTSMEKNLPTRFAVGDALWTVDLSGMSTPVVADG